MTPEQEATFTAWKTEFDKAREEKRELPALPDGFYVVSNGLDTAVPNSDGSLVINLVIGHLDDWHASNREYLERFKRFSMDPDNYQIRIVP